MVVSDYTLWRGDRYCGRVAVVKPGDATTPCLAGVLVPDVSFDVTTSVWQVGVSLSASHPGVGSVAVSYLTPIVMTGDERQDLEERFIPQSSSGSGDVNVRELPFDERFELRVGHVPIECESMMLQRILRPNGPHAEEICRLNGVAPGVEEVWRVTAWNWMGVSTSEEEKKRAWRWN